MDKEQLINAVRNATGGSFQAPNGWVTCLGWTQEYDEFGRPLYGDPNTHKGEIRIAGKNYVLRTTEFVCQIIDPETDEELAVVDFTPDYIKEYREKRKNS